MTDRRQATQSQTSDTAAVTLSGLNRRRFLGLGALAGGAALLSACGVPGADSKASGKDTGPAKLRALFMQQAGYTPEEIDKMTAAFTKANPTITVENTYVAYEALHDKIVISAPAGTYDVVLIDCIWPTELASKNMIVDVTSRYPAAWKDDILPGTLGTVSYQDKYYGVPWFPGGKVFFYNKTLLQQAGVDPAQTGTWDGCVAAARTLKQQGVVKYPFMWSWSQAEALICDYTQLVGAFGGTLVDAQGKPSWNSGGGVQALEWMVMTLKDGLTNPASTKALEDDVKKSLLQNQTVMALNWDYVFAASKDPKQTEHPGQLVVSTSPKGPGGKNPSVDGGMGLSITSGSKHQDAAWKLVSYLASAENQAAYADNNLPVWKSDYTDALRKGREQLVDVDQATYGNLISRPAVASYNAVSQVLQQQLQAALLGQKSPQAALDQAAKDAEGALGG
ncbi:ABC transporter substrate-binding protein [Angustibacter aerolatus]